MVWSQQQFGGEFATEHDKEPRSRPFTSHQVSIRPRHTKKVLNLACVVHSSLAHCSVGRFQGQMLMGLLTHILVL